MRPSRSFFAENGGRAPDDPADARCAIRAGRIPPSGSATPSRASRSRFRPEIDAKAVPNPRLAEARAIVNATRTAGADTFAATTARGGKWEASTVRNILPRAA